MQQRVEIVASPRIKILGSNSELLEVCPVTGTVRSLGPLR
jgi:hypothetical protein